MDEVKPANNLIYTFNCHVSYGHFLSPFVYNRAFPASDLFVKVVILESNSKYNIINDCNNTSIILIYE